MLEALDGKPALKIYSNVFTAPSGGGGANNGVRDNKNPNSGDTHFLYGNTIIKRTIPGNVIIWLAPGTATWKNNILVVSFRGIERQSEFDDVHYRRLQFLLSKRKLFYRIAWFWQH